MKSHKQVWIVALCLMSASVLTISLRTPAKGVLAAHHSVPREAIAGPANHVLDASMRAAAISRAMLLDDGLGSASRVSATSMRDSNPALPDAEEFTLVPPNPAQKIYQTTLAVRFPESAAQTLASQIPMTLANQHVVLQRSADDPSAFSTQVDFDWTVFLKQQQHRQQLANQGKMVPVYQGRDFIRMEKMQFIDPEKIEGALQTHQPVQFSPRELMAGDDVAVVPSHQLMIIDPAVVEDPEGAASRTYDACLGVQNQGNPNGAWTFKTLWTAVMNTSDTQALEQALDDFLFNFQNTDLTINNFQVIARAGTGTLGGSTGLLQFWPLDNSRQCTEPNGQTSCPSLLAPVRLNAIVNRIDLAGQPGETSNGELRFVFGVTASAEGGHACANPPALFNIIFEYHVPASISNWASQWTSLPTTDFSTTDYLPKLQLITNQVVTGNECTDSQGDSISCLAHIRTNEIDLAEEPNLIWEQREFYISSYGSPNTLTETTMSQTPSNTFNFGGAPCNLPSPPPPINGLPLCNLNSSPPAGGPNTVASWVNANQSELITSMGTLPPVINDFPSNQPFQAGSALNGFLNTGAGTYWNGCTPGTDTNCEVTIFNGPNGGWEARRFFSLNTCNGCHGAETNTAGFQQVVNRSPGHASGLSSFLLGCINSSGGCATTGGPGDCTRGQCTLDDPGQESVPDPANSQNGSHDYGDIARRQLNLQNLASPGNQLFLPFLRPKIGVH